MAQPGSPSQPRSWAELAAQWQATSEQWARWWTRPASASQTPLVPAPTAGLRPATFAWRDYIDPRALAALNEKYRPRVEALWSAAAAAANANSMASIPVVAEPLPGDRRFAGAEWDRLPFYALLKQGYLLAADYLNELAALAKLPAHEKRRLEFMTHQYLDAVAPTNYPATNPTVAARAFATEGKSVVQGLANLVADVQKGRISMSDERAFTVGRNIAVTPGSVVFRNELIELIQYAPTTERVHRTPLVIVPPCINKYYVLDLAPENSFVRWTVAQGHTVFMVSWRNIPPELGHLGWDDYIEDGALAAIAVVKEIAGSPSVNALGFCVGGTLLACTLAVLAARNDRSVQSATFFTTMLDFEDPGEIGVYVSREFLTMREPALLAGQRVHGGELAGAFASLRANELVWNYVVNNYLKGETPPAFDLLYWNSDSSNLPGPMYVYYLRNLYLDNRLREPRALTMAGERIDLSRVTIPAYVYASRDDHIVPWRSAYRTIALLGGETRFTLGASGHIAGVINPPDKKRRNYWVSDAPAEEADDWFARAQSQPGSWWQDWGAWLARHAGAVGPSPRAAGNAVYPPLQPAPGSYVLESAGPR